MKRPITRNVVVAGAGLLALTIYILACSTSFSPDDTKVLYPTFDPPSGAVGVAVYDRETRRSELLFVPAGSESDGTNAPTPQLLRSQWLADGRNILIAWTGGKGIDEKQLELAVMPAVGRGAVRLFHLPEIKDAFAKLMVALPVARDRVFVMTSEKEILSLDLKTGKVAQQEWADAEGDITLYPAPNGNGVFYIEDRKGTPNTVLFGRVDPQKFTRTVLTTITNEVAEGSFFTFDQSGKRLALLEKAGGKVRLVVLAEGKPTFTRPFGAEGEELAFGSAAFSSKGDLVVASFQRRTEGQAEGTYGLMEIPLSNAPIRQTVLFKTAKSGDQESVLYFQGGISHDGKTAAAASTYLACTSDGLRNEDCALFFVDLTDPNRKVTKMPIPVPENAANSIRN